MFMRVWCIRLGQEGVVCMRVGETVQNTLKGGGIEKRGGKTTVLKGWATGSRGVCFKKRGAGTPLQTM